MSPDAGLEAAPRMDDVLDAFDDRRCRTIVEALDEPMTASEIAAETDIPLSTVYRKLERLTDASLVADETEIRSDGHHATRYRVDFDSVVIGLDERLGVTIRRQGSNESAARTRP